MSTSDARPSAGYDHTLQNPQPPPAAQPLADRCVAWIDSRTQCSARPEPGDNKCRQHGGKQGRQVYKRARQQAAIYAEAAVATLATEMTSKANRPADRIAAAKAIIALTGWDMSPQVREADAREKFTEVLLELRAQHEARAALEAPETHEPAPLHLTAQPHRDEPRERSEPR